jgi:hypothetical protein
LKDDFNNVAMTFNPRMTGSGVIVRNARINGVWGAEERDGGMPIVTNRVFYVQMINAGNSSYEVSAKL